MKALDLLAQSNGQIVSLEFVKKDGSNRKMLCRIGVHKDIKGERPRNDMPIPMYRVWDMQKNAWRVVNGDTITKMKVKGKEYVFGR